MFKRHAVLGACPNLKKLLLATVSVMVASAGSTALAQEAGANEVDELVVTGYRKSLGEARDIKQASVIQVDAIVAEDMAKFQIAPTKTPATPATHQRSFCPASQVPMPILASAPTAEIA